MNQEKIGKFIVECRKENKLTQEQLAEKLGVTDRSVSNWENGICLPDCSLYKPLCDVLGITINELFAGQKIREEEYKKVADENLMKMLKYKLYCLSDKSISFDEFGNALTRISEVTTMLQTFNIKEEAVKFLMENSKTSYDECSKAYDFYINLFKTNTDDKK